MTINFQGQEYELYEKGTEKVETYYEMTDVGLNEKASYYEYINNENLFISIEKWKNQLEVSIGKGLKIKDIK